MSSHIFCSVSLSIIIDSLYVCELHILVTMIKVKIFFLFLFIFFVQVFKSLNLTAHDLSVDMLDVHAVSMPLFVYTL